MTEAAEQQALIETAQLLGWMVAHFRPAKTAKGWRTPVSADGAGFPDLVLVRDRIVFAELKGSKTPVQDDQTAWLDRIIAAGGEAYLWRLPADFDTARAILERRGRAAA
jgi:hypothetical protein